VSENKLLWKIFVSKMEEVTGKCFKFYDEKIYDKSLSNTTGVVK